MPCQMKWKSSTLDDLETHWQPVRSAILATAGLLVLYKMHNENLANTVIDVEDIDNSEEIKTGEYVLS